MFYMSIYTLGQRGGNQRIPFTKCVPFEMCKHIFHKGIVIDKMTGFGTHNFKEDDLISGAPCKINNPGIMMINSHQKPLRICGHLYVTDTTHVGQKACKNCIMTSWHENTSRITHPFKENHFNVLSVKWVTFHTGLNLMTGVQGRMKSHKPRLSFNSLLRLTTNKTSKLWSESPFSA